MNVGAPDARSQVNCSVAGCLCEWTVRQYLWLNGLLPQAFVSSLELPGEDQVRIHIRGSRCLIQSIVVHCAGRAMQADRPLLARGTLQCPADTVPPRADRQPGAE